MTSQAVASQEELRGELSRVADELETLGFHCFRVFRIFRVKGLGFKGSGFKGSGFRVQGLGFRV